MNNSFTDKTDEGLEIEVFPQEYEYSPDIGIDGYAYVEAYHDGESIELTEEEIERLLITANELDHHPDFDWSEN